MIYSNTIVSINVPVFRPSDCQPPPAGPLPPAADRPPAGCSRRLRAVRRPPAGSGPMGPMFPMEQQYITKSQGLHRAHGTTIIAGTVIWNNYVWAAVWKFQAVGACDPAGHSRVSWRRNRLASFPIGPIGHRYFTSLISSPDSRLLEKAQGFHFRGASRHDRSPGGSTEGCHTQYEEHRLAWQGSSNN